MNPASALTPTAALPTTSEAAGVRRVRYASGGAFHETLKRRVDEYFEQAGLPRRGSPRMVLKTLILLTWCVGAYLLLVFGASSAGVALLAGLALALGMAGVGFAIQHDANHDGYSEHRRLNRLLGLSLDAMGGSSFLWRLKHNVHHHTHTNLTGVDPDLNAEPLMRLSPHQPRRWAHRFQHLYCWVLYAFMAPKWQLVDDFECVARGHIHGHKFKRPRGWELAYFAGGKAFFFGWALVLPAFFHPFGRVALAYLLISGLVGITLGIFFQVAHCVAEADFPPEQRSTDAPTEWALHQVRTTVDFARGNRFVTWYLGGLNYQVVHHLFPKVCHLHYPAISRLVEETCAEFGERYRTFPSVTASILAHGRWLRELGRPA